jgi:hypothetical protein
LDSGNLQQSAHDNQVILRINDKTEEILKEIIRLYSRAMTLSSFLEMKWRNLSAGEQSRLTLYSRLYSLIDNLHTPQHDIGSEMILLLDECDIGFHPEWQRTLVNDLVKFLSKIFIEKNIQIIVAANSPFIISDLPRAAINFLEKISHKSETTILHGYEDMEPTFGGNIHLLLGSSFYMRDFMGEYAKERIDKAFRILKKKDISVEDLQFVKHLIPVLGEPVLSKHLMDLIDPLLGGDRIAIIDQQIAELERKRKRLNNQENRSQ